MAVIEIIKKHHYKIDEMQTMYGKLELWESEKHGDEAPAIVTLNGSIVGKTWDSLADFYEEEMEDA